MLTNIKEIEKKINIFIDRWSGNCYYIACEIVKANIVQGRAVYGHYYGPVAKTGEWNTRRAFQRHGWVVLNDGRIFDPTRWSFENETPYIAIFDKSSKQFNDYDEGGNKLRRLMERPPPEFNEEDKIIRLNFNWPEVEEFVNELLCFPLHITWQMVMWLANLSIDRLASYRKEIYKTICNAGLKALIPMDNFNYEGD